MANIFKNFKTKLGKGTLDVEAVNEHINSGTKWIQFPDGTMICSAVLTLRTRLYTYSNNDALVETWNTPKTFIGRPDVILIPRSHKDGPLPAYDYVADNKTRVMVYKRNGTAWETGDEVTVTAVAIGKWK